MARAFPVSDLPPFGHDEDPGEWHALRGELVALLDHVEGQYARTAVASPELDRLARRMRDLRAQVGGDAPRPDAEAEAFRPGRRAERFGEAAPVMPPNPRDVLNSAISEIRMRHQAPRAAAAPRPAEPSPQFDRLAEAVGGLVGRLERLEDEIKAQRDGQGNLKEVADQVAQLTQVVELLAGAVGETGQVKRLESQISGLAKLIGTGKSADMGVLTDRLEEVAVTVDRLVQLQREEAGRKQQVDLQATTVGQGMKSIEDSVRSIYDRIDAMEKSFSLPPADLNRLTEEMAAFTREMRQAGSQAKPNQLLARVDALNARLVDIEAKDGVLGGLKADLEALRGAVVGGFEPRIAAIEKQLGTLSDRIAAPRKADPSIAQIEKQIRQLVSRMDETGTQLTGLAKLYAEGSRSEAPQPDLDALATLVAQKTSDAVSRAPALPSAAVNDATLAELEKRMSRLFAAAAKDKPAEDFSGVHDGIKRVDERLDRLEAALRNARLDEPVAKPAAAAPSVPPPMPAAAKAPAMPGDAMPANPGVDAPLVDKGFGDGDALRAALAIKTAAAEAAKPAEGTPAAAGTAGMRRIVPELEDAKPVLPGMTPVTPEMVGGRSPRKPAAEGPQPPAFDPASVARPPRPESSLDQPSRDAFDRPKAEAADRQKTEPVPAVAPAAEPAAPVNRNTFIEAARRAAQRQAPAQNETGANSLIGRALARVQASQASQAAKPESLPEAAPIALDKESPSVAFDEEEPEEGFLSRHRQPILLAAALVAVGFLTVNLVSQRLAPPETPGTTTEEVASLEAPMQSPSVEPAPEPAVPERAAEPAIPAAPEEPMSEIRAVPGADLVDEIATGAINPHQPMAAAGPAEVVAMPQTLMAGAERPAALPEPAPAAAAEPEITAGPVKVEMPPEALGPVELRQAAADGDPRAQFEIAAIYGEGRAVTQDFAAAAVWYERSAAQGFAPAQYRLGNLYEAGKGVAKDLEQARLWYQRAAEAGNRMAMHNLAALHAGGQLGKQEFGSAAQWFEQAADRGMTDSQFNLGMLYARGLGVTQDLAASYKWFSLAAASGDTDAVKARDDVAKSLDAATVTRLAAEIAAWKPQSIDLLANFAPIGTWSASFDPGQPIDNKTVVQKVQSALARLGYDVGNPDGLAGPKTEEAIKAFERATGMSEVGTINPRLLAVLGSQPV